MQNAVLDMSTTAQIRHSLHLGSAVLSHIGGFAKLHKPKAAAGPVAVLEGPAHPQRADPNRLYQQPLTRSCACARRPTRPKLADAIMQGIRQVPCQIPRPAGALFKRSCLR